MSQPEKKEEKKAPSQARQDMMKEIDALYRSQIKQIYTESKDAVAKQEAQVKKPIDSLLQKSTESKLLPQSATLSPSRTSKGLTHVKSSSNIPISESINSKYFNFQEGDEKVRASVFLRGESTRTIEILRKENETKELKIRELTNRCQGLIDKLKKHLEPGELENQLDSLREFSDSKVQRLENLFKIKNEEIFFKIKLQTISLLQEFGVGKDQLSDINDVANETSLFSYMTRKLKGRLKDFRSKEQESTFEIQKDKILSQKQDERIHYLTETNQLLRLSQGKLKGKVEDLKGQMNQYIQRLRQRQQENEQRQSQIFRLRKQNEELSSVNQKLSTAVKGVNSEKVDERRVWQAKDREMKNLLNNYLLEKKKLQAELEEKEGQVEEILIKQKFLQQENERINRELVRWKERYEWIEKEKEAKIKELEEQKNQLSLDFEQYKLQHNQGIILGHRSDVDDALRKVEEYQNAYQSVLMDLEEERRLLQRSQEQAEQRLEKMQREWLQRVKKLQKVKEEEIFDLHHDNEVRQNQLRQQFQQKEKLLAEEMQARMKALFAQRDKKTTEQLISLSNENDQLRRDIQSLQKLLDVKQSLIAVIQNKNSWSAQQDK